MNEEAAGSGDSVFHGRLPLSVEESRNLETKSMATKGSKNGKVIIGKSSWRSASVEPQEILLIASFGLSASLENTTIDSGFRYLETKG